MTAESEAGSARSALAGARAWQTVALPPELRRGVEAAARAAGLAPEAWLTRTVLAAAKLGAPRNGEAPLAGEPNAEVARSLATLLSAARARARERQAEASASMLVELAPGEETPLEIRLTAERAGRAPAPRPAQRRRRQPRQRGLRPPSHPRRRRRHRYPPTPKRLPRRHLHRRLPRRQRCHPGSGRGCSRRRHPRR